MRLPNYFLRTFRIFIDLKFAIFLFLFIAFTSSLGSIIEQEQNTSFYFENYPVQKPIYGFIDGKLILQFGFDHLYTTFWFSSLLVLLGISLIGCTFTRQFPIVQNSKQFNFRSSSISETTFFLKLQNFPFFKESFLLKLTKQNFYCYQKKDFLYAYKGLIGRISPILVHISLIVILLGGFISIFQNFKAEEIIPKGESFHVQNTFRIGSFSFLPSTTIRVNDFWIEYKKEQISQFYSDVSILDPNAKEKYHQIVSVNHPLRWNRLDIYQSDWSLTGARIKIKNQVFEYPLYSLNKKTKTWFTWIEHNKEKYLLIFDQNIDSFLVYNQKSEFLRKQSLHEFNNFQIEEILPSTGLLVKYDPSIPLIYTGFVGLICTTFLSLLPYQQFWFAVRKEKIWCGSLTNRLSFQFEVELENYFREVENQIKKSIFQKN
jgi:cytochrome c biogenesis protein